MKSKVAKALRRRAKEDVRLGMPVDVKRRYQQLKEQYLKIKGRL